MIIYLSLLVCLVGLVMYLVYVTANPATLRTAAVAELGRIMFAFGLLAFLLIYPGSQYLPPVHVIR
jgi:hypothetical protein